MSFRTLRFGDRTISYDTGLDLADETGDSGKRQSLSLTSTKQLKLSVSEQHLPDDGIGTSDDETGSNSSTVKTGTSTGADGEEVADVDDCCDVPVAASVNKKVIKLDMSQLLAFDEEEEDDYAESEYSNSDTEDFSPSQHNRKNWHKAVAKDLVANLTRKNSSEDEQLKRAKEKTANSPKLVRRHSITLCQTRKVTPPSTSGPTSLMPWSRKSSDTSSTISSRASPQRDEVSDGQDALKTLNLELDEVAHIRSVLTKAQLESLPLDGQVRQNVERGKACFVCMITKFGLFSRGQKCEMCKQIVCSKCYSKMRIPTEHFTATPVFALSPYANGQSSTFRPGSPESAFRSLAVTSLASPSTQREKKLSLPASLNAFSLQSVGSAPNSPTSSRKSSDSSRNDSESGIPTISGSLHGQPQSMIGGSSNQVVLRQQRASKYATLPRNINRLSWIGPRREEEREKLEGSLLAVCTDCKDMVVQVIRVSRTNKRLQSTSSKSMQLSLTPDVAREFQAVL